MRRKARTRQQLKKDRAINALQQPIAVHFHTKLGFSKTTNTNTIKSIPSKTSYKKSLERNYLYKLNVPELTITAYNLFLLKKSSVFQSICGDSLNRTLRGYEPITIQYYENQLFSRRTNCKFLTASWPVCPYVIKTYVRLAGIEKSSLLEMVCGNNKKRTGQVYKPITSA